MDSFEKKAKDLEEQKLNGYTQETSDKWEDDLLNTQMLWSDSVAVPLFRRHIAPGSKVLDVGCGSGRISIPLAQGGCTVTGLDSSAAMLGHLEKKAGNVGVSVETVQGNARELPFPDESFDAVISMWFLMQFPHWKEFLADQIRVAKKGGLIMFDANFKEHEYMAHAIVGKRISRHVYTDDINYDGEVKRLYWSTVTMPELKEFCEENGVSVADTMPYSFFQQNALLMDAVSIDVCVKALRDVYRQMIQSEEAMKYLSFYENEMISRMPFWFTRNCMVVLKKE